MQKVVAERLAQPLAVSNKVGGHRPLDVQFRLPAAGNALRAFISCDWWTAGWLASHAAGRYSDVSRSIGLGRAFLHLCPAGIASPNLDQRTSFSSVFACIRNWSLAQQRPSCARSDDQPSVGFHADAKVRD